MLSESDVFWFSGLFVKDVEEVLAYGPEDGCGIAKHLKRRLFDAMWRGERVIG
jgi:hypothetical protein